MTKIISELDKYNQYYCTDFSHGDENAKDIFKYRDRGTSLILSAPHATCSFVKKKDKVADMFTGALTEYLGNQKHVSTLIRVKYTPYKALISDYIFANKLEDHYFLDIHGFNKDIDYEICLGIADCKPKDCPYLKEIIEIAKQYHLRTVVNHPNYTGMVGLTGRYQLTCGKPNVIQMELRLDLRDFYHYPDKVKKVTIPFLTDVINLYRLKPE